MFMTRTAAFSHQHIDVILLLLVVIMLAVEGFRETHHTCWTGERSELRTGGYDELISEHVLLTVSIDGGEPANITIGVFGKENKLQKTVHNFVELCRGDKKSASGLELTYKQSKFHMVVPDYFIQGGDFTNGNGTGGESIYQAPYNSTNPNAPRFKNEVAGLKLHHSEPGIVSMANGPVLSGSTFFITLAKIPALDGRHVVFGKVIDGMEVVKAVGDVGSGSGKPTKEVIIVDSGVKPPE